MARVSKIVVTPIELELSPSGFSLLSGNGTENSLKPSLPLIDSHIRGLREALKPYLRLNLRGFAEGATPHAGPSRA